jgi:hypothetical protein
VPFGDRLPFTVSAITKLANASDPRSSSLAVYHDKGGNLFIWGLIDQGKSYHDFVTHSEDSGPERPGKFQASIVGVGHVVVYRGYELIGDFHVNKLRNRPIDALSSGPLHKVLFPAIQRHIDQVRAEVGAEKYRELPFWDGLLASNWLTSLRRLLLHIQQYRHGGAVLISPHVDVHDLNIKYRLTYDRLRTNLHRGAIARIKHTNASNLIYEHTDDLTGEFIPIDMYLEKTCRGTDVKEINSETEGALWFTSLLSRVDGAVLLTSDLEVQGFGVEIQVNELPTKLAQAADEKGTKKHRIELDYFHFGTRHRSMMRFCAKVSGSVGFVVSQDGGVRAMTQVNGVLLFWDNIQLLKDDFDRRTSRKRK